MDTLAERANNGALRDEENAEYAALSMRPTSSPGNVFADLALPHPERELLRARLTLQIYRLIKERDLTQAEAGQILGIEQPNVSALMRNRSGAFSVERLVDFLAALGSAPFIRLGP